MPRPSSSLIRCTCYHAIPSTSIVSVPFKSLARARTIASTTSIHAKSGSKLYINQRQKLNSREKATFEALVQALRPMQQQDSPLDPVYKALEKTASLNVKAINKDKWGSPQRVRLTEQEKTELDQLKHAMAIHQSDHELLNWGLRELFGVGAQLPGTPLDTSSFSRISKPKASIVFELFLLLRDTHRSPNTALYIFSLACRTPEIYIRVCTTKLYNEVLRTRWMMGDIEGVAHDLEGMWNGGVQIDQGTQDIVKAVGDAIRLDQERAEKQFFLATQESSSTPSDSTLPIAPSSVVDTPAPESAESPSAPLPTEPTLPTPFVRPPPTIDQFRLFSSRQIEEWRRMERVVQTMLEESETMQEKHNESMRATWRDGQLSRRKEEEAEAERNSPDLISRLRR
ncbi:hypothetical protein T439DRAFT_320799 [Meredithblackwellia eburnea MCA 4105]